MRFSCVVPFGATHFFIERGMFGMKFYRVFSILLILAFCLSLSCAALASGETAEEAIMEEPMEEVDAAPIAVTAEEPEVIPVPEAVPEAAEEKPIEGTTEDAAPTPDGSSIVDSGTCGDGLTWELGSNGLLNITGTGRMTSSPWSEWDYQYKKTITKVTIGDEVLNIPESAFASCENLVSVAIGNNVKSIGVGAFFRCEGLNVIVIPDNVTSIGTEAFSGCTSLESISVSSENKMFASVDGVLFNKNMTKLCAYPGGKAGAYSIPAGITSIESLAFSNCISLTDITIPAGVRNISEYVFYDCTNLTTVIIPDGVTSISYAAFSGCSSLTSITIPKSVTQISYDAFDDCWAINNIYYTGSEEQWDLIDFSTGNEPLITATIHFNTTPVPPTTDTEPTTQPDDPTEQSQPTPVTDTHIPGDVNGDGVINVGDLIRLMRYLTGVDVELH